jgi:hypothetical protein
MKEYILCSAIHYDDGKEYVHQPRNIKSGYVLCGRRHHNIINTQFQVFGVKTTGDNNTQGFLTNIDRFVNRKEGYKIALEAGQIKPRKDNKELNEYMNLKYEQTEILVSEDLYDDLYSEDLY